MIKRHVHGLADETPDVETASDDYARRFSGPVGAWFLDEQERACLELLSPWPGGTVLDVGGGHGQVAVPLAREGHAVTVVGSAPACRERLDRLARRAGVEVAFEVGELLRLPYADRSFDLVVSFRLLPHVPKWRRLAAAATSAPCWRRTAVLAKLTPRRWIARICSRICSSVHRRRLDTSR